MRPEACQTLFAELPLNFGQSLCEENIEKIREAAFNGIRTFPKPEKLQAAAYFLASVFIAYEHFVTNRDLVSLMEFTKLNNRLDIKVDIRKSFTYIKNQLKAYKRANPYDLSLIGKI